jgi:osmotically inducible protein OsmC
MEQIRQARATWSGNLTEGSGSVEAATSGAFGPLATTWRARTEASEGKTSPEELLAAAHAACYSMAFSSDLSKAGFVPDRVDITATVTFERLEKWTVVSSALEAHAWVKGIEDAQFQQIAEGAKDGCPISRALAESVQLSVNAVLER